MKKTAWFPGNVKPVHVGLYEQKHYSVDCIEMYYWDGTSWYLKNLPVECNDQNRPWRGLMSDAAAPAALSQKAGE